MALVGLYGALAASASVFIGILTALLASDLSSLKAERTRIRRRIDTIDPRLQELDIQRDSLEDTIDNIENIWADEEVEDFIEHIAENVTLDPGEVLPTRVYEEFAEFKEIEEPSENQIRAIHEHFDEIEEAFTDRNSRNVGISSIHTSAETIATNHEIETQWKIHRSERHDANMRDWIQTITEIRSLKQERDQLEAQYESLDPKQTVSDIKAAAVTIVASVLVPLTAYLLREIGVTIPFGSPAIEAILITIVWAAGLGWVLLHLWRKISQDEEALPDPPNLDRQTT